jgi:uncharacterized membrane protein YbaN (DUF454 family)
MIRIAYRLAGLTALALGFAGLFLPLLPTVPFVLLAAFCFAKGHPAWERRLLDHPRFGPHIVAWRSHGAISRKGKIMAAIAFAVSSAIGLLTLDPPWSLLPLLAALVGGSWVLTRPNP